MFSIHRLKRASFSAKCLFITVGLIVLTNCIQLYRSHTAIDATNSFAVENSQRGLKEEAVNRLRAAAKELAGKNTAYLENAFQTPSFVARQLETAIGGEYATRLSRRQVEIMTQTALEGNPLISSIYVDFEVDAFDGSDELYKRGYSHSVADSGIFSLYFVRQEGEISQYTSSAQENSLRYSEAVNEFGFREGEWYLCPMETQTSCLLEPYFYEDEQGLSVYLTSLTVPVVVEEEFLGVVGVDINLPRIQALTDELSQQLYDGKTRVTLVSKTGLIVGSSHYKEHIARKYSAVDPVTAEYLNGTQSAGMIEERHDRFLLIQPVNISNIEYPWTLIIEAPAEEIYASSVQIKQQIESMQEESMRSNLLLGVSITMLGGLLIGVLVKSATKPINQINERVEVLSDDEGNLGVTLDVSSHAEFIRMSHLINRLIVKLRNMVISLQEINANVTAGTGRVTGQMETINSQVAEQSSNLENVACAMQQMNGTSVGLAENAERAAGNSVQVKEAVLSTQQTVVSAQQQLNGLTQDMRHTHEVFNRVASQSKDISQILDVIRNVSDQTNLLALNAAIEASRAGENGRGFAVVAEEVRMLAQKTRASVDDISANIQGLISEIDETSLLIRNSFENAEEVHQLTSTAFEAMNETVDAVISVADDITQMASAVEEQSMVSAEINDRLAAIATGANKLDDASGLIMQHCDQLHDETIKQEQLLSGLRT